MPVKSANRPAFPSAFVDRKTGRIKRFQTLGEKFFGEILPGIGDMGAIGVKALALAPLTLGQVPFSMAAAGVVGGMFLPSIKYGLKRLFLSVKPNSQKRFRLDKEQEAALACRDYGHPRLPHVFARLTHATGLEAQPVLSVVTSAWRAEMYSQWNASADDMRDGSRQVTVGDKLLQNASNKQIYAVMAHEFTHFATSSSKALYGLKSAVNSMTDALLLAAIGTGTLETAPVLCLTAGVMVARKTLQSIGRRHNEAVCDRGAALMTGMGADLISAFPVMQKGMWEEAQQRRGIFFDLRQKFPALNVITRINGAMSHPHNDTRVKSLKAFESAYPAYCAKKRNELRKRFNPPAVPPARLALMDVAAAMGAVPGSTEKKKTEAADKLAGIAVQMAQMEEWMRRKP